MNRRQVLLILVLGFIWGAGTVGVIWANSRYDVNWDGEVNVLDVQLVVNGYLGVSD